MNETGFCCDLINNRTKFQRYRVDHGYDIYQVKLADLCWMFATNCPSFPWVTVVSCSLVGYCGCRNWGPVSLRIPSCQRCPSLVLAWGISEYSFVCFACCLEICLISSTSPVRSASFFLVFHHKVTHVIKSGWDIHFWCGELFNLMWPLWFARL